MSPHDASRLPPNSLPTSSALIAPAQASALAARSESEVANDDGSDDDGLILHDEERARDEALRAVRRRLDLIPRYLELQSRRLRTGPLPAFDEDPLRQGDLLSMGLGPETTPLVLPPADLAEVRRLCGRLWSIAADEPWVERYLLHLVGSARDEADVSLWQSALAQHRAGPDAFAAERRTYALSALASLASIGGARAEHPALRALREATTSRSPGVRAASAAYLLRAYALCGQSPPAGALDLVQRLARNDEALEPRFFARLLLEAQQLAMGTEHVGASYVTAVESPGASAPAATIRIPAVCTLAQVHRAVVRALGAPHGGYVFYLRGEFRGGRYDVSNSEGRGAPPGELPIGDLGLLAGHAIYCDLRVDAANDAPAVRAVRLRIVAIAPSAPSDFCAGPSPKAPALPAREPNALATVRHALVLVTTHVNGTKHYDAPAVRAQLTPGAALVLRREPTNSYDDRAIEVLTREGAKLGYVPRVRNRAITQLLDAGCALSATLVLCEGKPEYPYVVIDIAADG